MRPDERSSVDRGRGKARPPPGLTAPPEPRSFAPAAPASASLPAARDAQAQLEAGDVVRMAGAPPFELAAEADLLFGVSAEGAKNVSFDPASGRVKGLDADGPADAMAAVLDRFGDWAQDLVGYAAPDYGGRLRRGKASFRPRSADAALSARKDDRRLHVDAFPSQPVQGRRILRVFLNVNPEGVDRVWAVGERFRGFAARFLDRTRLPPPGASLALDLLGITKGRRADYDWLMLQLHDAAKRDEGYQASAERRILNFAPGASWMVFSDVVVHAAVSGRYAFEQTFLLDVDAMAEPELSPLKVLEGLTGRRLA